ncbi:MAG: hypothetical protein JNJ49_10260 [Bdellovibrionaceae bacterium]|nr:hypothetical protein [Pseudobdellovibrionaceae bacterium]
MKRTTSWRDWIFDNGSYKLVSLLVTLILWVTILGRRDFVLTKDMDVEFLLPRDAQMETARGERRVSVKVSGPRSALKKFGQAPGSITVDLTRAEVLQRNTRMTAELQPKNIEVPFGVKVVSIAPERIDVVLSPVVVESAEKRDTQKESLRDSKTR